MEGYERLSKSFLADLKRCPYRAFKIKVERVKAIISPSGRRGRAFHHGMAEIRRGAWTLEQAQEWAQALTPEDDRDEVAELIGRGVATDPANLTPSEEQTLKIEHHFAIDGNGNKVAKKDAMLSGIMDRCWRTDNDIGVVDDLKSGWDETESSDERHCYVLGVRSEWPDLKEIHFALHYVRPGRYLKWCYYFEDDHVLTEVDPRGNKLHWNLHEDALLHWLHKKDEWVRNLEPYASPGPHCQDYYGIPCQFLANGCPLDSDLPVVVDYAMLDQPGDSSPAMQLLRRVVAKDPSLTKEEIIKAFGGCLQLQGFSKLIQKGVEDWALRNGSFDIGEITYGWFTTEDYSVDAVFALSEMLREMPIEDVVSAVNISKTSLEKISKRKYKELREGLLAMAVDRVQSKPTFGTIKSVKK